MEKRFSVAADIGKKHRIDIISFLYKNSFRFSPPLFSEYSFFITQGIGVENKGILGYII